MKGSQGEDLETITKAFMKQYYLKADYIPGEIYVPVNLGDDAPLFSKWLSEKRGSKALLVWPQRGEKAHLLRMCQKNAKLLLQELKLTKDSVVGSVAALQDALKLDHPPVRIEAFDVSNIQGAYPVASMVCFVNGQSKKSEYRRFRIRTISTPDDFTMMKEAVRRRYRRIVQEDLPKPDLILIDGGKGQLSAACAALSEVGVENLPIIALAKRLDEVYIPHVSDPQNIRRDSSALRLLQRIRDEAHRFAVTYHRQLRKKKTLKSLLEAIPGIGPRRRDQLLTRFGSLKKIKMASIEDLIGVEGMTTQLARDVYVFFHPSAKE
jgi:excinuclease ABC subunit C